MINVLSILLAPCHTKHIPYLTKLWQTGGHKGGPLAMFAPGPQSRLIQPCQTFLMLECSSNIKYAHFTLPVLINTRRADLLILHGKKNVC